MYVCTVCMYVCVLMHVCMCVSMYAYKVQSTETCILSLCNSDVLFSALLPF